MAKLRSATLEVLNALAWRRELDSRPSLNAWLGEYDTRLASQLNKPGMKRLESLGYLAKSGKPLFPYLITSEGLLRSSHGFDVETRWKRPWDGEWHFLMFDVDARDWRSRTRLQRWLKEEKFGKLQGSVWIIPEFERDIKKIVRDMEIEGNRFFVFKGRDIQGLITEDIIENAWHFEQLREAYRHYIDWVEPVFTGHVPSLSFLEWQTHELEYWRFILELDPFLPETLCPTDYPGRKAWKLRKPLRKSIP